MGEYYIAISLTAQEHLSPHDYNSGAKLSEHAYILNDCVRTVCFLLMKGQRWYKHRLAWVGDSAKGIIFKECEDCFEKKIDDTCPHFIRKIVGECHLRGWEEAYAQTLNVYQEPPSFEELPTKYFILNHTKREYIDCGRIYDLFDDNMIPHPLPHRTKTPWGTWLRDILSVSLKRPKEFKEDKYNIHEY